MVTIEGIKHWLAIRTGQYNKGREEIEYILAQLKEREKMVLMIHFTKAVLAEGNHLLEHIEQNLLHVKPSSFDHHCIMTYSNIDLENVIIAVRVLWNRPEVKRIEVINANADDTFAG